MRKKLSLIILIIGLGLLFYVFYAISTTDFRSEDTDALYGGRLEFGYSSAGYLLAYTDRGFLNTCGFAVLNETTAITAAHCVDDAATIEVGKGSFSRRADQHLTIDIATQKQGWVQSKDRVDDFAILNFNNNSFFPTFAEVVSPKVGCNYRIVGYGRTENSAEDLTKPRKSARVCISEIDGKTFKIQGDTSGLCFGDSGSPVYLENTDQVVGVTASIIKDANIDPNDPCSFGNRGVAVRADTNLGIINESQAQYDPTSGQLNLSDQLTINVAAQSDLGGQQGVLLAVSVVGFIGITVASIVIYGDIQSRRRYSK